MEPLPAEDLRSNLGTWAVATSNLPAVANFMHDVLPNEPYDPHFHGQYLCTTYFDTQNLELRKNRATHDKYITLRLRSYHNESGTTYAVSAKTESTKFRVEVAKDLATALMVGADATKPLATILAADLFARLLDIGHNEPLVPAVTVCCRRYSVEDEHDRYTLDVAIGTTLGKQLPYAILEFKSTDPSETPKALKDIGLPPTKMSKFLWATTPF